MCSLVEMKGLDQFGVWCQMNMLFGLNLIE